jgi:hypothetical protein
MDAGLAGVWLARLDLRHGGAPSSLSGMLRSQGPWWAAFARGLVSSAGVDREQPDAWCDHPRVTDEQVRVRARDGNIAVTQLDGRAFPGIPC